MLTIIATGALIKDPIGTETYTMWKVRCCGKEVTLFSGDDSAAMRRQYSKDDRIRGEGRGGWNDFNDTCALQISGSGIDGSDAPEDSLIIRVDGSINHELNVDHDAADEGGGRFIPVEIEAPVRGKDSNGEWADLIAYVRGYVIGDAVDQLLDLDKKGVTSFRFEGYTAPEPEFIKDTPAYYAEITKVAISQGRGGDDDAFWAGKPRGLAKLQSAPAKAAASPAAARAKKRGGGGSGNGDLNDPMPF